MTEETVESPEIGGRALWPAAAAALLGAMAGAILLLVQSASGGTPVGCSPTSGCGSVLASGWSRFVGVPVLVPGLALYLLLLVCVVFGRRRAAAPVDSWRAGVERTGTLAAWVVIFGALWFVGVQAFILKAFCAWCCAVHGMASLGAVLHLLGRRRSGFPGAGPALAMVGLFAASQALYPPPGQGFLAREIGGAGLRDGRLSLYGGALELDRDALPMVVEGNGDRLAVLLSDFTCLHCLEFHEALAAGSERVAAVTGVAFLPAYHNANAREVARLMLVLRRADPEVHDRLLRALASGGIPARVADLERLAATDLEDHIYLYRRVYGKWADEMIQAGERLMALNQERAGAGIFPQILIGERLIEGVIPIEQFLEVAAAAPALPEVAGTAAAAGKASEVSSLVVEEAAIQLGRIPKGRTGRGVVHLRNEGSEEVRIPKLGKTCGCLDFDLGPRRVPPGGRLEIPFGFHTDRFLGEVSHSILIFEEGAPRPLAVPVSADVWLPVSLWPLANSFGRVAVGTATQEKVVPVVVTEDGGLEVTLKEGGDSVVTSSLRTVRAGKHYELVLAIPQMPDAEVAAEIILRTSHPDCPEIVVPVRASPAAAVEWAPPGIDVSALAEGRAVKVRVFCNDQGQAGAFEVIGADYRGGQAVKASLDEERRNGSGSVRVELGEGFDPTGIGVDAGYVEIRTNHPEMPVFKVPLNLPEAR